MAPEMAAGISPSESLQYNLVWTEQFRDQFRLGQLYPRWLPDAWGGLGSPTFYIYAPLYSWVAALVDLVTLRGLPVERLVPVTSMLVLTASGWSMYEWLRAHRTGWVAVLGALAYVAAPYHLHDIYARGALAESCAYAVLPMLALGIFRLGEGSRSATLIVALAYALLIFAHLPSALIVSYSLLPIYLLSQAPRSALGPLVFLGYAIGALLLGIALAALYLLPALTLTAHISYDAFFGSFYRPESWFFWRSSAWPRQPPMTIAILACCAALPLAALTAVRTFRDRADAWTWSIVALLAIVMVSGVLPVLWQAPLIAKVQFPFRFLVIVEFAVITAVALARPPLTHPLTLAALVAWSIGLIVTAQSIVAQTSVDRLAKSRAIEGLRSEFRDAPEYLPPGARMAYPTEAGVPEASAIAIPNVPPVAVNPPSARWAASRFPDGGGEILVDSRLTGRVSVRRFYFPHWHVTDANGEKVAVEPDEDGLLSWPIPAGRSRYRIESGSAPGESQGAAISAAALLLWLLAGISLRLQKRSGRIFSPIGAKSRREGGME